MHLYLVGAGPVGLVTAVGMTKLGHHVTVADIDRRRIENLRAGVSPIYEPGLAEAIQEEAGSGHLRFTTELSPPADAACSIVTVSTPVGPGGTLSTANVEAAVRVIFEVAPPDHVIVIRSTLPIEGVDRLVALRAGRPDGAAIVTNPEFLREGSALANFERHDRIVVGWLERRDIGAAGVALALYDGISAPTLVADARSVTMIKLASNVFLAAKIAYANELARLCDAVGADIGTVVDGLGLDARIGRAFLTAGPGFGGSCLPDQAVALSVAAAVRGVATPLLDAVSRSNDAHQLAIIDLLGQLIDGGADPARVNSPRGATLLVGRRIALLGLAFKANTDDVRVSPALALARHLRAAGATVVATDPRAVPRARIADPELVTVTTVELAVEASDAVVVVTEWPEYGELDWRDLARRMRGDLVYDTRGIVSQERVREAGLRLASLGRADHPMTSMSNPASCDRSRSVRSLSPSPA